MPFATGVGANVQEPGDWEGNLVRQLGFQVGVANPTEANTIWRQLSSIASMIGQFSADYSELASVDDGDIIEAEDRFVEALIKLFSPFGVYYIQDTGTGNHVVGTSDHSPASYAPPCFVIFKKSNTDNDGPMDINLWTLGAVPLKDNTGADLAAGAIKSNSFYMASSDGGGFRILGGAVSYTSVSNLVANSGDAIEVTVDGDVNWRTLLGAHDTNINNLDRWLRGRNADDHAVYLTTLELIAWLNSVLSFLTEVPPNGMGPAVGQDLCSGAAGGLATSPTHYGYTVGMTTSGANLAAGTVPGVSATQFAISATEYNGYWMGSTPTGTWQLVGFAWGSNEGFVTVWSLFWRRIA
jgi:hypothetical protein